MKALKRNKKTGLQIQAANLLQSDALKTASLLLKDKGAKRQGQEVDKI